jgi:octaprenyl-diphosphate synthase
VDAITAIGQYLQEAGGKRLRPSLLLLSSKLIGDGGESAIRLGVSACGRRAGQPT